MKVQAALGGGLVALISSTSVWAQETTVELKGCFTSEATIIDRAGDVAIGMNVTRGVTDRASPGPFPEKTTHDCRVVFTASKAGVEFTNRCNFVDADGDKILSVATGTRDSFQFRWIAGTGKFLGISGNGTAVIDAPYPRANPTLSGACWRGKVTYTIKK
jgi:hypothetical protein